MSEPEPKPTATQIRNARKRAAKAAERSEVIDVGYEGSSLPDRIRDGWDSLPSGTLPAVGAGAIMLGAFVFKEAATIATVARATATVAGLLGSTYQYLRPPAGLGTSANAKCGVIDEGKPRRWWIPDVWQLCVVTGVAMLKFKPLRPLGLACIAGGGVIYGARVWWRASKSPIGARWTTKQIASTLRAGALSSSQQRQVFVDTPIVQSKPQSNHTHGVSARDRNAGSATAATVALALGLEPYFVQQSLADVRKGHDGDRSFHWPKDLAIPPKEFHFDPEKQAAILVDVDYYIDMPVLLARYPGTYLVSAFQPVAAGKSTGEYTFRFLKDNKVEYRVSGGAEYVHHVWDYAGDTLLVEDVGLFSKVVCSYHIDRKRIDEHHSLILLSLIGRFEMAVATPTSWYLEGKSLLRLEPVFGSHVVLDIVKEDGIYRSVAMLGNREAVTLPMAQYDAIRAVAVAAKQVVSPATIASNIAPSSSIGLPTERLPPGHAAILTNYLRSVIPHSPPVVYPPSECLVPIYFSKHDYDAPVALAGFGSPLIGPCYGFAAGIASDHQCIAGRVEAFHDGGYEEPIPPTLAGYMAEFIERLIPVPHQGVPVDDDYVREKQARPIQRTRLDRAEVTGDSASPAWDASVKIESHVKPTVDRNISMNTPLSNLKYSKFMYAFHNEVMAKQEWYAFAKTPAECAERVCVVLAEAAHSVLADGSKFDGHVKRRARLLERMAMLRFFAREFHARLNESMDEQIAIPGKTKHGRRYWSGYGRGSGSLETSDFNSVLTAFIDYCAWRNTTINGVKCSADTAWSKLGIYGGDDSLAGAVDPAALKKSSELMGQDYEITVVPRGDIGVEFLNRRFSPGVWYGDTNSMANPSRLLAKLWVGPTQLHEPMERFAERCSGYYRMDRNSPVIGEIVTVAHELLGERVDGVLMPWDGRFSLESNWPNQDETGWMMDVFNASIPDFDFERFAYWICEIRYRGDAGLLLKAPLCTAHPDSYPAVKVPCVVGERLAAPEPEVDLPPKDKEEACDTPANASEAIGAVGSGNESIWRMSMQDCWDDTLGPYKEIPLNAAEEKSIATGTGMVAVADTLVPKVGENGKRVPDKAKVKPTSPKQTEVVKKKCEHKPFFDKHGERRECVCQWTPPRQLKNEPIDEFKSRMIKWKNLRYATAKKRGISPSELG